MTARKILQLLIEARHPLEAERVWIWPFIESIWEIKKTFAARTKVFLA